MRVVPIRVLVADGEETAREGLAGLLRREGFEVVGLASDSDEAFEAAHRTSPDVAIVDVRMPGGGAAATRGIIRDGSTRVIALSAFEDREAILDMLLAGAVGYLVKGTPSREILDAVRRAARGQGSLSVEVLTGLVEELLRELIERSDLEQTLRRSEEKFRGLLESAPDAVLIANQEGEIVLVNEQTELMFGYSRADMLGKAVEFLIPERFHHAHIEHRLAYRAHPMRRPMGAGLVLVGRRANGTEIPLEISLSTLSTSEGTLVTAFIRDASEREPAREEMRSLEDGTR